MEAIKVWSTARGEVKQDKSPTAQGWARGGNLDEGTGTPISFTAFIWSSSRRWSSSPYVWTVLEILPHLRDITVYILEGGVFFRSEKKSKFFDRRSCYSCHVFGLAKVMFVDYSHKIELFSWTMSFKITEWVFWVLLANEHDWFLISWTVLGFLLPISWSLISFDSRVYSIMQVLWWSRQLEVKVKSTVTCITVDLIRSWIIVNVQTE